MRIRKYIKISLLFEFFILVSYPTFTQDGFINPSQSWEKKKELLYGIDNRRTHIQQQSTLIYGLYTGVGFGGVLRLKIGISGTPFEVGRTADLFGNTQRNRFYFLNIGQEFDFYVKNRFRITAYGQAGYGFNDFRLEDENNQTVNMGRVQIIPLEIGLHANYDIFPWLRFKLGGGWRFVFPESASYLSGYYIKIGFGVSAPKLLNSYRSWKDKRGGD